MKKILSIMIIGTLVLCGINAGALSINYPLQHQLSSDDKYDMVIIAPDIFASCIRSLIDHKNTVGIRTFLKTTEEIYLEYNGRDTAEQIKYFIYESVENLGIKYVLLIGDIKYLPIRISYIKGDPPWKRIPTDLYYSDLYKLEEDKVVFDDWDSNGNGVIGEFFPSNYYPSGDNIDLYPDVSIGRIPCSNNEELSVVINKIISYESTSNEKSWFKRLILMGGDTFPNFGVPEGEFITDIIREHMDSLGFDCIRLWTSLDNYRPRIINQEISNGAGFVCYSGHGFEQGFGTSIPYEEKEIYYFSPYIIGLSNEDKLPIFYFDACSTAKLDFKVSDLVHNWSRNPLVLLYSLFSGVSYKLDNLYPCFAWEIVKKSNGGGIAAIGATRSAKANYYPNGTASDGSSILNIKFFENYEKNSILGQMFTESIISYINSLDNEIIIPQVYILIGDPSLKIGGYI